LKRGGCNGGGTHEKGKKNRRKNGTSIAPRASKKYLKSGGKEDKAVSRAEDAADKASKREGGKRERRKARPERGQPIKFQGPLTRLYTTTKGKKEKWKNSPLTRSKWTRISRTVPANVRPLLPETEGTEKMGKKEKTWIFIIE